MNAPWPADAVQRRPIGSVAGYAKNARMHSDEQVAQIMASMREWGFTIPLLVDEAGVVIAGHGRLEAAKRLNYESVPVMVAAGWSEKQIRAYRVADNKLALNAVWDVKLLAAELGELVGMEALIGFSADELKVLAAGVGNPGLTDPDEAGPLPANPITQAGDLWRCGKHLILCGDATKSGDVGRLWAATRPILMVTDPPYGVEYDPKWRKRVRRSNGKLVGALATGEVPNDNRADWREAWALYPGDVAYVWHASLQGPEVFASLASAGFAIRNQIIWAKSSAPIGRGDYHWRHEPCWYGVRANKSGNWYGGRNQNTVWEITKQMKSDTGHSTQKPVECMRRPMLNNSAPGDAIYDPFVGSGTTMIAAEMEARIALCIDITPGYVDVAVERWQAFTGEAATLDGDGRSFAELAAEQRNAETENAAP